MTDLVAEDKLKVQEEYKGKILDLVSHKDPILFEPIPEFDFSDPTLNPLAISKDLCSTLIVKMGLGLAANQVGLKHRVFVMYGDPMYACFNPKIVSASSEMVALDEGCLSYPGITVKIKRPKQVRVRFQVPTGVVVTKVFDGMTARVFQHELDHLDGTVFYKKAHLYHRELATKRIKKLP
jgi:peptide deformylase